MDRKQALFYTGIAFFVVAFMVMLPVTVVGLATDHLSMWKTIDIALVALFAVIFVVMYFISTPAQEPVTLQTSEPEPIPGEKKEVKHQEGYCPWCGRYIGLGCPPQCPWCGGDLDGKN